MNRVLLILFAAVFSSSAAFAEDYYWNAADDFNPVAGAQNPTAVWTYRQAGTWNSPPLAEGALWAYLNPAISTFPGYGIAGRNEFIATTNGYGGTGPHEFLCWTPMVRWLSPVNAKVRVKIAARQQDAPARHHIAVLSKNGVQITATGNLLIGTNTIIDQIVDVVIGDQIDFKIVTTDTPYYCIFQESISRTLTDPPAMIGDYLIYDDAWDGNYKAVRLSDGVVLQSDPADAAAVINGLLNSLTLCFSIAHPNSGIYKEGIRVNLASGLYNTYQTIVIPPTQDFIFDADKSMINPFFSNSDVIRIDSAMNSKFILPMILSGNNTTNTGVRIKPQNPGPDDLTVFTTSELYIEALVGDMDGLTLDASAGGIEFLCADIKEINLSGSTSPKRGLYIPAPGATRAIRGNELRILRVNTASQVANVVTNSLIYKNLFFINDTDAESIPVNISTSNSNTIKKTSTGW